MKKKQKTQLTHSEIELLKRIKFNSIRNLLKKYNKESIILNNSSLLKEEPTKDVQYNTSFTSSGCTTYSFLMDESITSYESLLIDLYNLENIINKL